MDDHQKLLHDFIQEWEDIFNNTKQGVYVYLDDFHKICNTKFATILSYPSAQHWADIKQNFTESFVDPESQETLVRAYQNAMEHGTGSYLKINWKDKHGKVIATHVILIPVVYRGHTMALHFVETE